jgi:hypothetical protein
MRLGTKLQFDVPDMCPTACPHQHEPFDQGSTCARCPVFCCNEAGGMRLAEPDRWHDGDAESWQEYLGQFVSKASP